MGNSRVNYSSNAVLEAAWLNPTVSAMDAMKVVFEPAFQAVEAAGYSRGDVFGAVIADDQLGVEPVGIEADAKAVLDQFIANNPSSLTETMVRMTLLTRLATSMEAVVELNIARQAAAIDGAEALNG